VKYIVFADDGFINILDGGTGELAWQLNVDLIDGILDNDLVYTTPTLGYFDANNDLDLLFGTTDGNLYLFQPESNYDLTEGYSWSSDNVNSDKIWSLATNENFTRSSPVLGKLNLDNYEDIVVGTGDKIFAVSGNTGKTLWEQTLPGRHISSPIIYKDGANYNSLVTTLNQTNLNYSASFFDAESEAGNRLDVLYYDISSLPIPNLIPSPAAANLDGKTNNDNELIICTPFEGFLGNGRVYVYFTNRSLFWSTPPNFITGQIEATPAIADLDGDGNPEIVVISWKPGTLGPVTHIYCFFGNNGTLAWHVVKDTIGLPPFYTNERAISSPIIADVNTDETLDVIFTTSPNLYVLNGLNGTDIWDNSFFGTGRELWCTPAAGDIDNDGFLDIVLEGAAVSHVIIDLTMTENDLSLSSENITENQLVTIKSIIHNKGTATAESVKISCFENDILIDNVTSGNIPGGDSREVRFDWTPSEDGTRIIKITIDPNNAIEEINENNNEITKEVHVIPTFPDLIVDSVQYYRGDGKEIDNINTHLIEGENSTIKVLIKNIGGDEGRKIKFMVLDWGVQIGDIHEISFLDIQEIETVNQTWHPGKGMHEIGVMIDPEDTIGEVNETNNEYKQEIKVNNKKPIDPKFICEGEVVQPDEETAASNIEVTFTNNRTGENKITKTNSTGYYKINLQTLPEQYLEGDEIIIYASDGENESTLSFKIYSEDRSRFDNITLVKLPTYAVSIEIDSSSKTIYPNDQVRYNITLVNRGNEYNTINLSISEIEDRKTGEVASDWEAYLNEYMVEDIPPKSSQSGIVLTVKAPLKNDQARALDQVLISITVVSFFDPNQMDVVGVTTTVGRVYGFSLTAVDPKYELQPDINSTAKFDVVVTNSGNDDDTINLELTGPGNFTFNYQSNLDLLLGEEKNIEIFITSESIINAGEYTFTLSAESIDEKGYVSTELIVKIIRPDLRFFQNITYTPFEPQLSKTITFEVSIYNDGNSDVSAFFVEFRANGPFDDYDIKSVINLSAKDIFQLTFNWTPTRSGEYTLEFEIDPYNDIIEATKNNNLITLSFNFSEDVGLLKEPVFSNNNPKDGEKITISITVKNLGNVDITKPFQVYFYDGNPDDDGERFAIYNINEALSANSDLVATVEWKVKGEGDHQIFVEVNPNRNFSEINYGNNKISKSIHVLKESKIGDLTDYSSWIILLIFVVGILIIVFLFFSPDKQPRSRYKKRSSKSKKDKKRSSPPIRKSVKFIELDSEEASEEESEEDEDDEKEIEDLEESKASGEKNRTKGKVRKTSGIGNRLSKGFNALFSAGPGRISESGKTKVMKKTSIPKKEPKEKIEPSKTSKPMEVEELKIKSTITDEEIAEVQVIGEGEVEDEDWELANKEDEKKKKLKGKGKSEGSQSWEYSHLIGIR
jgi:subtilase family serine protease